MNTKLKTNLILFLLVLLTVFSCTITTYAQVSDSPSNSNIKYFYSSELSSGLDPEEYQNWYNWSSWYGKCAVQGSSYWAEPSIRFLLERDIIRGVNHDGKNIMPSGNYIIGRDALGITLFFHWGDKCTDRKATYNSAVDKFNGFTQNILTQTSFGPGRFLTRKDAILILAGCVDAKSSTIKLDNYSDNAIGFSKEYPSGIPGFSRDDYEDYEEVNSSIDPTYKQAITMLMELGVFNGKIVADDKWNDINYLAPDDTITYEEYYCLLVGVYEQAELPDPPSLSAKLAVSTDGPVSISYKDFLDGTTANINVTMDASDSEGSASIDSYNFILNDNRTPLRKSNGSDSIVDILYEYTATQLKFTQQIALANLGDYEYDVEYKGNVTVKNSEFPSGKTADNSATTKISITNEEPVA